MRKMTPGWTVKGKLLCIDCVGPNPGSKWKLIRVNECSNAKNHKGKPKRKAS